MLMYEINAILFFSFVCTVIMTVLNNKRTKKDMFEMKIRIKDLEKLTREDRDVIADLIKKEEEAKRDIKAISDAINVYSSAVGSNIAEKVKDNIDLFNEWISGEEE